MASSTAESSCRSLQSLPAELLLEISKYITDFTSLNGLFTLFTTHNRGISFIQKFQTDIFANVIRANREDELTRVITAAMTLRNDTTIKRRFSENGHAATKFVWKYIRSPDIERAGKPHYLQWFSDPIATIHDIWCISMDIENLVQAFVNTCIIKQSERKEQRPVSTTELYRTRRAFWRFELCYDMCHAADSRPSGPDGGECLHNLCGSASCQTHRIEKQRFPKADWLGHTGKKLPYFLNDYLQNMCQWEVEEFEAVRCYLVSLTNKLQYGGRGDTSRLKSQPALVQRLIDDLSHWQEDKEYPINFLLVGDLRSGLGWNASPPVSGCSPRNGEANEADIPWVPIPCPEQWGWRMWDKERVATRLLISD